MFLVFFVLLWHCWLIIRKSIWPVKFSDEAWLSVWSEVQMICVWSSWCHCHPIISCIIKLQTGLTFLVPAYPGCPRKEAVKRVFDGEWLLDDSISTASRWMWANCEFKDPWERAEGKEPACAVCWNPTGIHEHEPRRLHRLCQVSRIGVCRV